MTITIEGPLRDDAHKATRGISRDAVIVLMIDAGASLPFEAVVVVGATPEAHAEAERTAGNARKGMLCRIQCADIAQRTDHGERAMLLRKVTSWALVD